MFLVSTDETVGASSKEQLPLVVHFVNKSNYIREEFVEFIQCDSGVTGEAIAMKVLGSLQYLGVDPEKLHGQAYHGSGSMAEQYQGVHSQREYPKALYVLNLSVVSACSIPLICNLHGTLQEI